jgi:NTP pyrophosphatase (non-canonical NTP hydrolase)
MTTTPPIINDQTTTLEYFKERLRNFTRERDWDRHHTPDQLAIAISIEAAELLEKFQWGQYNTAVPKDWADELADIVIYAINFANAANIDLASTMEAKLNKAEAKYPLSTFGPGHDQATNYWAIKKKHRAGDE